MMSTHTQLLRMPHIKIGSGCLAAASEALKAVGARRVLIVTSPELAALGMLGRLQEALARDGEVSQCCYDAVQPDPTLAVAEAAAQLGSLHQVEAVIALGGGSPIDTAKAAAASIASGLGIRELLGTDLVPKALPIIAIPTTAGTGSEVTAVAVLTDPSDQVKKGIVSEKLIPTWAILDPDLTVGLPARQTAFTGLDALSHAIEAYLSNKATLLTDFYAAAAIPLIVENLPRVFINGKDLEARQAMQLAAYYAGLAFANAGVTAAHAFAYPLGARYHLPHGLAVTLMLPAVLEYNLKAHEDKFTSLARILTGRSYADAREVVPTLVRLCRELHVPLGLDQLGVEEADLSPMAESVLSITRILDNNPKPISKWTESMGIYTRALHYSLL